jgi:hypothetical protein
MAVPVRPEETANSKMDRAKQLEAALLSVRQVDCPVRHYFAPGLYAREITIPKGTAIVGAVHKTENIAVLSKGALALDTENGPIEIHAPFTLTVKPGAKNVAFAIEESVWTNFFVTTETDVDKLVEILTESKATDLIGGSTNQQLQSNKLTELQE